jgi:hypothetical protein
MRREKGSGSIYKRDGSPVWWIKYHRHGRAFRESLKLQESDNRVEQERLQAEEQ